MGITADARPIDQKSIRADQLTRSGFGPGRDSGIESGQKNTSNRAPVRTADVHLPYHRSAQWHYMKQSRFAACRATQATSIYHGHRFGPVAERLVLGLVDPAGRATCAV